MVKVINKMIVIYFYLLIYSRIDRLNIRQILLLFMQRIDTLLNFILFMVFGRRFLYVRDNSASDVIWFSFMFFSLDFAEINKQEIRCP